MHDDQKWQEHFYSPAITLTRPFLCLHSYLDEYNLVSKAPMKLVMFKFAIEHISRVSRVLLQDNGHCLLVGEYHVVKSILKIFYQIHCCMKLHVHV